jgi:cytochrome c-type protein NapC
MSEQQRGSGLRGWLFSKGVLFAAMVFGAGVVFAGVFNVALDYTNTTEFCTSCHTMQTNLNELKEKKSHWTNLSGVSAGCSDCHVPKQFGPKMYAKIMAAKDVFHEIIGTISTPEKYEAHRLQMAQAVWAKMKASNSRECRNCHSFQHMDLEEQDKFARRKHSNATERGDTCIDCHKGVAHKLPKGVGEDGEEGSNSSQSSGAAATGMAGMDGMSGMSGMDGMQGMGGMSGMSGMDGMQGMGGMSGMQGMGGM